MTSTEFLMQAALAALEGSLADPLAGPDANGAECWRYARGLLAAAPTEVKAVLARADQVAKARE